MKYIKQSEENSTLSYKIEFDKKDISKEYDDQFAILAKDLEIEGFRKGKVPAKIAKKHIKKEVVYQNILKVILPKIYQKIVTEQQIQPITNPKIELINVKEAEPWTIILKVAQKPKFDIPDYKSIIQAIKAKSKASDIWIPGKDKTAKTQEQQEKQDKIINSFFQEVLKVANIDIPFILIEEEVNKRISQLVDNVTKAGLTLDSYLESKKDTIEAIKKRHIKEISQSYTLEFLLEAIADKENITVEPGEVEVFIQKIQQQTKQEIDKNNMYLYTILLRRQKLLDFLASL